MFQDIVELFWAAQPQSLANTQESRLNRRLIGLYNLKDYTGLEKQKKQSIWNSSKGPVYCKQFSVRL